MSLQKRSSSSSPNHPSPTTTTTTTYSDIKHRVITCLNKLADRDTLALAVTELESIAKALTHDTFSPFLHCLHNTDSSSKSSVRRHCVNLLAIISRSHGNLLSHHLPKILSTVSRRLRDPDSSVRSACVDASSAISSHITKPPFSAVTKPFIEILTGEQDSNAQIGAAMCLAAAIEAAPEPEPELLRNLLPRLVKLLKLEGFKAKAALLAVIGSIVGVGGARGKLVLDWLVPCLVDFLSCEDWATRKAAAEALGKVATMKEKAMVKEHKDACLSALANRRFDKVKVVRETLNRTLELWKEVPGISDDHSVSDSSQSRSLADNVVGGFIPSVSKEVGFNTPVTKKIVAANRSPPSEASLVTTARKQSPDKSKDNNSKRAIFRKQDHGKLSAWKIVSTPREPVNDDVNGRVESGVPEPRGADKDENPGLETNSAPFNDIRSDHKLHKFGVLRSRSRVVPYNDDENCYAIDVQASNTCEELYESQKDLEELSLIRKQLIQIENQQSDLLDLLQRFMGSSQSGINSLETRVNGLERALDEISYDLAVSNGRASNLGSAENTCCKLPGAEFLSSKFWRRADGSFPTCRLSSSGHIKALHPSRHYPVGEMRNLDSQRFQQQSGNGFVTNPLAVAQFGKGKNRFL